MRDTQAMLVFRGLRGNLTENQAGKGEIEAKTEVKRGGDSPGRRNRSKNQHCTQGRYMGEVQQDCGCGVCADYTLVSTSFNTGRCKTDEELVIYSLKIN